MHKSGVRVKFVILSCETKKALRQLCVEIRFIRFPIFIVEAHSLCAERDERKFSRGRGEDWGDEPHQSVRFISTSSFYASTHRIPEQEVFKKENLKRLKPVDILLNLICFSSICPHLQTKNRHFSALALLRTIRSVTHSFCFFSLFLFQHLFTLTGCKNILTIAKPQFVKRTKLSARFKCVQDKLRLKLLSPVMTERRKQL